MVVNVQTLAGRLFTVKTSCKLPILYIMRQLEIVEGIPRDQQRLVFSGRQLEEDRLLSHYDFKSNNTMHLVLRPRGD